MRFQPPGLGRSPSGIGRPAELVAPLSSSRNEPRATSANAGACLEISVKPRCAVYHATAASTSSTMYLTLTVSAGMTAPAAFKQDVDPRHEAGRDDGVHGRARAS